MLYTAQLTQKGQVTIPVDIRRYLGLFPRQKVAFIKRKDQVLIKPAKSFLDLAGSIVSKKRYSDKKADKAVGKFIAKEYAKKNSRC